MLPDLYSDVLLEAAAQLPEARPLAAADARATKTSRVCGSTVSVELCVEEGCISAFAVDARACALGQASAALVARHIVGTRADAFQKLAGEVEAMLRSAGTPPTAAPWDVLAVLAPIREYPARHRSTLLVFEATLDCLGQLEDAL